MNVKKKCSPFVGIDVSKETFNAYFTGQDFKYSNSSKGWNKLLKEAPANSIFVMEVTGTYHYKLASYLHSKGNLVKVFNALRFSHWLKLKGYDKAYTDLLCARYLSEYANTDDTKNIPCWEPLHPKLARARIILTILRRLSKLERQAGNVNESASKVLSENDNLLDVMGGVSDYCLEQKYSLEKELVKIVSDVFPKEFKLLLSIPSIGKKTAASILAISGGFGNFKTSSCLSSYFGLCIRLKDSGTSVHFKGKITKLGNSYLRGLLYMCAMTAIHKEERCKELYSRLISKGKNGMLALTAVMHKLVKISFGVVNSGVSYKSI